MNSTPVVPAFSRDKHHTDGKSEYITVSEIEQDHMITLIARTTSTCLSNSPE